MWIPDPDLSVAPSPARLSRKCAACEEEGKLPRMPAGPSAIGEAPAIVHEALRSSGQPLDTATRAYFERRFGHDFSRVSVHTDTHAVELSQALRAEAFTYGNDIYFNQRRFAPNQTEGRRLLAHELAHVAQQTAAGSPRLQRRLLLTGGPGDIDDFITMAESASGLVLKRNALTNQVTATGSSTTPARSPAFAAHLTTIMDDPHQDAEIHVGRDQPKVVIGAFPEPKDFTGSKVQRIDMDDVHMMEAGTPGIGVADLMHEIVENYVAHAAFPVPGFDLFPAAHKAGSQAESEVATDILGSGRWVAIATAVIGADSKRVVEDYDTYYVLRTVTRTAPERFSVSNVSFAPKVNVTTETIDQFPTESSVVPATGAAATARVVAALTANVLATVKIEGFTDDQGPMLHNLALGEQRADAAARKVVAAGVNRFRIQQVSQGATGFVALNDTEANRAQNRRVVFTVTRPGDLGDVIIDLLRKVM